MVVSKHRDHFRLGYPAYSTGINLFPSCGVGCLFSDGSSIIGMLAVFWNNFCLCIATHQTGKFLLSFCFTGGCGYYLSISVGMILITALFRIIGNITGSIIRFAFMPVALCVKSPAFYPFMVVFLFIIIGIMEDNLIPIC